MVAAAAAQVSFKQKQEASEEREPPIRAYSAAASHRFDASVFLECVFAPAYNMCTEQQPQQHEVKCSATDFFTLFSSSSSSPSLFGECGYEITFMCIVEIV